MKVKELMQLLHQRPLKNNTRDWEGNLEAENSCTSPFLFWIFRYDSKINIGKDKELEQLCTTECAFLSSPPLLFQTKNMTASTIQSRGQSDMFQALSCSYVI